MRLEEVWYKVSKSVIIMSINYPEIKSSGINFLVDNNYKDFIFFFVS